MPSGDAPAPPFPAVSKQRANRLEARKCRACYAATLTHWLPTRYQHAAFYVPKGGLLQRKRMPFTMRKDAFYNAKSSLLRSTTLSLCLLTHAVNALCKILTLSSKRSAGNRHSGHRPGIQCIQPIHSNVSARVSGYTPGMTITCRLLRRECNRLANCGHLRCVFTVFRYCKIRIYSYLCRK